MEFADRAFWKTEIANIPELAPERWNSIDLERRTALLQEVEKRISSYEGRPAAKVTLVDFENDPRTENWLASYNPASNVIGLSPKLVGKSDVYKVVQELVHEARHAYQEYALEHPGFHQNQAEVREWREGRAFYPDFESKGDANEQVYNRNPLERDATIKGNAFVGLLKLEHSLQRARQLLDADLLTKRAKREIPPSRTETFEGGLSVAMRYDVPLAGVCEVTIVEGTRSRRLTIEIPKGYRPEDLLLNREEAAQILRRGHTASGKLRFRDLNRTHRAGGEHKEQAWKDEGEKPKRRQSRKWNQTR